MLSKVRVCDEKNYHVHVRVIRWIVLKLIRRRGNAVYYFWSWVTRGRVEVHVIFNALWVQKEKGFVSCWYSLMYIIPHDITCYHTIWCNTILHRFTLSILSYLAWQWELIVLLSVFQVPAPYRTVSSSCTEEFTFLRRYYLGCNNEKGRRNKVGQGRIG